DVIVADRPTSAWSAKMNASGVVSGGAAAVVLVKVALTPPTVRVVLVAASAPAALVCRTQTAWPGATLPAAVVNAPPQPREYSPPVTVTGAAVLMPAIVAAPDTTRVDGATSVASAKAKASGVVSAGIVVLVNVAVTPP